MSKSSSNYYLDNSTRLGWGEKSQVDEERIKLLKQFIYGKKILDVGCGFGQYVDFLSSQGFESFGVDNVAEFIRIAKLTKRGIFVKGKAEKLPFEANFFDTVCLFDILEHADDIKILKEAKRISIKRILVIVPRVVDQELESSGIVFRHYIDKTHLREYREADFKKLADFLGLKLIHLQTVHNLNSKNIFIVLFRGPTLFRDIVRKIVFWILPRKSYPTEYFAVFEK